MKFRPLTLSVNPVGWRMYTVRKANTAFLAARKKIWQRDNNTCQFCGFQAQDYQEIINIDSDYENNKASNLITACCFCAQCFFIESIGLDAYGGGTLIYCPELSQPELNSLCHVLFCAIANGTGYKDVAQSVYRSLKLRSQPIEDKYGEGCSEPSIFGRTLIEAGISDKETCDKTLQDLRILPSRAKFRTQIEHWAAAALLELEQNKPQ